MDAATKAKIAELQKRNKAAKAHPAPRIAKSNLAASTQADAFKKLHMVQIPMTSVQIHQSDKVLNFTNVHMSANTKGCVYAFNGSQSQMSLDEAAKNETLDPEIMQRFMSMMGNMSNAAPAAPTEAPAKVEEKPAESN